MNPATELLSYPRPAAAWEEALPIGNGRLGAMIHGGTGREIISLNEETLWSGLPGREFPPEYFERREEARRLIAAGKYREADRALQNSGASDSASYQPAGELVLDFGEEPEVRDYRRTLDLSTATATVEYRRGGVKFRRECFASEPAGVLVIRLTASEPVLDFTISFTSPLAEEVRAEGRQLSCDGHCPWFNRREQLIPRGPKGETGIRFRMLLEARTDARGKVEARGGTLTVRGAREVLLPVAIASDFKDWKTPPAAGGIDPVRAAAATVAGAAGYDALFRDHLAEYRKFYLRSLFEPETGPEDQLPTDRRLRQVAETGRVPPALAALLYHYGRYLLIASSRPGTQPANLQGIWNRELFAPWGCNYTTNINLEMNYWPAEITNLPECAEPLFRLIRESAESGEMCARQLYRAPGWCLHHNTDLWRFPLPATGEARWSCWPMAGAWLCRHLTEHFEYGGDREFLKTALPLLRGQAEFLLSLLEETPEGTLTVSPSTSPENAFRDPVTGEPAAVAAGSLMDLSLIRELFKSFQEAAKLLAVDDPLTDRLRAALPRIAPPRIGTEGELLEYGAAFEEVEPRHRHLSHLYAAYPGDAFYRPGAERFLEAAKRSLDRRGDRSTGWAMGWRAALRVRFRQPERFLGILREFLRVVPAGTGVSCAGGGGVYLNLFDAHPPFQIDGNFGITAAIAELFIQSFRRTPKGGPVIELFPCLPAEWRAGRIRGLRSRGGLTADLDWDRSGYRVRLSSSIPFSGELRLPDRRQELRLGPGEGFEAAGTFPGQSDESPRVGARGGNRDFASGDPGASPRDPDPVRPGAGDGTVFRNAKNSSGSW